MTLCEVALWNCFGKPEKIYRDVKSAVPWCIITEHAGIESFNMLKNTHNKLQGTGRFYTKVHARNSEFDGISTTSFPKLGIQCSRNSVQVAHGLTFPLQNGAHPFIQYWCSELHDG